MYSLNKWLLVGMMLEWERHGVDREGRFPSTWTSGYRVGASDSRSTPGAIWPVIPYANMSFGVNVNSFGKAVRLAELPFHPATPSPGDSAGRRLHAHQTVRAEHRNAYKRNDGHATIDGVRVNDWNASSFGFLFGAKMFF